MLNRIRASVVGDAPESPRRQTHSSPAGPPATPQQRGSVTGGGGGGLFGFLKHPSAGSHDINSDNSASSKGVTPIGSSTGGFFGSLIGSSAAPPSPLEPDSPRTIRASAAALLKFSTTPPLFSADSHHLHSPNINSSYKSNSNVNTAVDMTIRRNNALEEQINKQDQHIMKLEHDLQRMQQQQSQLSKDNNTIRRQQLESTHRHAVAIRLWRRTNDGLASRVECFEKETTPSAAREIACLIRDAAPQNKDSAYLMMLQDQLTKATTKLDHLSSQTEIVLHKGEEVVESLREEMNEVIRDRCKMEIELMDQEYMLEEDMKRLVLRTERRLKRVQGEIDFLEKNAVEALKSQEEEDGRDAAKKDEGEEDQEKGEKGDNEAKKISNEEGDDEQTKLAEEEDQIRGSKNEHNGDKTKKKEEEQKTPELLRQELRKIAMERDRCLSVLQKKLREKNEEFNALMKLKESRTQEIEKIETERREREEWEQVRLGVI